MGQLQRGYALLTLKSVDDEARVFSGIATDASVDRVGDVVDPLGATFSKEIPVLLYHDSRLPVGNATLGRPTTDGIPFTASIPRIDEPGTLKSRVDEAWQSIKSRLIRGVSIGFRTAEDGAQRLKSGGLKFVDFEILELSLVAIPANANATILSVKDISALDKAATGDRPRSLPSAGVSAVSLTTKASKGAGTMRTITEQISAFEASRQAKAARRNDIMQKASDEGVTLDAAESEEYATLSSEIKGIDEHLVRLNELDEDNRLAAKVVVAGTQKEGAAARDTQHRITVRENLPPGIEFARHVMCKVAAFVALQKGEVISAAEIAKQRYPDSPRVIQSLQKTAVAAGTTSDATWAAPLVNPSQVLASEFLEYLRPQTIIGKFGTTVNGVSIPSLRRVPFNVTIGAQTVGGSASWVGQGKGKPVTKFGYENTTLTWTKIAGITVITEELARFSSPSAETLVRDQLAETVKERMDIDFIDPAVSAISGVRPASITNGVTPMTSAGTSAANVLTDLQNLFEPFLLAKVRTGSIVLIMPETLAMVLSLQLNALGQRAFPNLETGGGKLAGFPVITTQYAANEAQYGNMVIAVNASDIALADDGQVTVDASREASIEMSDAPANESVTPTASGYMVSMFQTNSIALRAERFINWKKLRTSAVALYDDVNWGSIGSPV